MINLPLALLASPKLSNTVLDTLDHSIMGLIWPSCPQHTSHYFWNTLGHSTVSYIHVFIYLSQCISGIYIYILLYIHLYINRHICLIGEMKHAYTSLEKCIFIF